MCNIGPAEIARRRRAGHTGVIAALALLVVLVAIGAPPIARLLIALPVAVGASGYLQAWLKFCAGFGSAGVFNFGERGTTQAGRRRRGPAEGPREGLPDRRRGVRDRVRGGRRGGAPAPLSGTTPRFGVLASPDGRRALRVAREEGVTG